MNKIIRLSKSVVGEEEKLALARVIDAGYLGMGAEVRLFEEEIRQFLGTSSEVICVNTGTAALHLALQALDIGVGDEVLVPSLTYVATFQAISATGAKPVACDVNLERAFIDIKDAQKRLTKNTQAIIPVHYGSSSDGLDEVCDFAKRHGLRTIEDAAHSFGCDRAGEKVGAKGDIICFSFDGIKNITSGEGGAVVTGDVSIANKIKDARLLGVQRDTEKRYSGERSWMFDVAEQGWRYHMSNLMAAIGREQLKKIGYFSAARQNLAQRYFSELSTVCNLSLFAFDYKNIVPHIFPLRVLGGNRDLLQSRLKLEGIESGIHYQPNHSLAYFQSPYQLPITETLGQELISIPLHPEITDDDQTKIIKAIVRVMKST
jgi:dTDP-4-amino-4,6-dideoxygalactose transaminase